MLSVVAAFNFCSNSAFSPFRAVTAAFKRLFSAAVSVKAPLYFLSWFCIRSTLGTYFSRSAWIASILDFALKVVTPASSSSSFWRCLSSRVISLKILGGMWSLPVSEALCPRSSSGYFFTMCFQNSSCHHVSFFLLPTISLAQSRPSAVSGTKDRCMWGVFSSM